jgi:hypothetical protein
MRKNDEQKQWAQETADAARAHHKTNNFSAHPKCLDYKASRCAATVMKL